MQMLHWSRAQAEVLCRVGTGGFSPLQHPALIQYKPNKLGTNVCDAIPYEKIYGYTRYKGAKMLK